MIRLKMTVNSMTPWKSIGLSLLEWQKDPKKTNLWVRRETLWTISIPKSAQKIRKKYMMITKKSAFNRTPNQVRKEVASRIMRHIPSATSPTRTIWANDTHQTKMPRPNYTPSNNRFAKSKANKSTPNNLHPSPKNRHYCTPVPSARKNLPMTTSIENYRPSFHSCGSWRIKIRES